MVVWQATSAREHAEGELAEARRKLAAAEEQRAAARAGDSAALAEARPISVLATEGWGRWKQQEPFLPLFCSFEI